MKRTWYLPGFIATCLIIAIFVVLVKVYIETRNFPKYPETVILNMDYQDLHRALFIELPVTDYDWEETAHALGIPVDSLSIDRYFHCILK